MKQSTFDLIKNCLSIDETITIDETKIILKQLRAVKDGRKPRPGTIKEASEILDVCTGTVRRYAKAGLLTPIKITCRKVRYDINEVEELARSGACD